jgi:phage portal protein BeeE
VTILDRILGRNAPPARKATLGGAWLSAIQGGPGLLELYGNSWNERAGVFLAAYKVDWFYKAGSRIAADFATLDWTLSYEDSEGDNEEEITAAPGNVPWERLDPLEQFLRLAERPNPWQTGLAFRQQQQIRLDFTGRALIYVEDGDGSGLPTALYGISPERMWPSRNARGELIGWLMDKDAPSGGVPFTAEEIIPIETPGPGLDPQGVVEAVHQYAKLAPMIPNHTADVLSTGGRLAGMAWPKERSLSEDEFADAQRAWRNVTSDPNAARRLLLFPEPMEYQAGAVSSKDLQIPELASLSRDEVLTAFPIAPEMLMVPMAAGLNSGATQVVVEMRYWSGTMHPRVEVWEETLQQSLIPRYEKAIGRPLDFDIEEPDLDDAPALLAKADALARLVELGFDAKSAVSAVGLDHIEYIGPPEPEPVVVVAPPEAGTDATPEAPTPQQAPQPAPAAKARKREDVIGQELPGFAETMAEFLRDQRARLLGEIEKQYGSVAKAARKALPETWWDQQREDALLREALRGLYLRLSRTALQTVADELGRVVFNRQVTNITEAMLAKAATRITGINETTREAVREVVAEGVRRGYSIPQIANGVEAEGFRGVNALPQFDTARADLVARTETMLAYNESAIRGYAEYGVEQFEAIDGDFDEECEARNGQVFSAEEALEVDEHPNGTLDWIPLTDKAWHRERPSRKESDDHFYGAWSGGSASEGGHPTGKPASGQSPIDKWVQSQPAANRAQLREWAETGTDVEARIARLPEGATPPLPDTLEAWQTTAFGEIRDSAANGLSPDPKGQEIVHAPQMAKQLMDRVADGDPAPDLYRSIAVDEATASQLRGMRGGATVDMNLSSWSSVEDFAASQGSDYLTDDLPVLVTFMANGAQGIELASHIPDATAEWVTAGRFIHDGAVRMGDSMTVYLRYEAAFTTPAQYAGTR